MLGKTFTHLRFIILVMFVVALPQTAAAYGTFNLADQWSDTFNPNGRWTYYGGPNPMQYHFTNEWGNPAWSTDYQGAPQWFKCTSDNPLGFDIMAGDVGLLASISSSNAVTWTVDSTGLATISGGVWMIRDMAPIRINDWFLYLNGVLLTDGQIYSGDPYSRGNPFLFADGSGGAGAVTNFAVTAGDIIRLTIYNPGPNLLSDYAGVNLSITTAVPAPPALWLMGSGLLGLWGWRRRKMRP